MAKVRKAALDREAPGVEAPKGPRGGKRRASHYTYADGALSCDACGGDYGGAAPFRVTEVPPWMLRCPVCGLRITKVGEMPEGELLDWAAGPEQRVESLEATALALFEQVCRMGRGRYDIQEIVDGYGERLMLAAVDGGEVIAAARRGLDG